MRILHIVERAAGTGPEGADDTIFWLLGALAEAGIAEPVVLLRGAGVDCAASVPAAPAPAAAARELAALARRDAVFAVAEDLAASGMDRGHLVEGVRVVPRSDVDRVIGRCSRVWRWS